MDEPGDRGASIYLALCWLISNQAERLDWDHWTTAEWAELANRAEGEGVGGVVYQALQEAGWLSRIPPEASQALANSFYRQAAQNALLLDELGSIATAFSKVAIPLIALKGAALARDVYPDSALRPMNDMDLLVRPRDVARAAELMRSRGYRTLKSSYHMVFQGGPQASVVVELHWGFMGSETQSGRRYLEGLWERALAQGEGSAGILGLDPMDNLLYLSAHLVWQHLPENARLVWFYDLYLLVKRYMDALDWEALAQLALQAGWAQPLYHALEGVEERFGWQAPGGLLQALCEGDPQARLPVQDRRGRERRMAAWLWAAMGELGWRQRARAVMELAVPHPEYMRWRYKPRAGWLLPLYYPLRWWMLLRDGLANWLKQ